MPISSRISFPQVSAVLFILGTDVFQKVAVWDQSYGGLDGEGSRVVFRVIVSDLQIHVAEIAAAIALRDVQGFAPWVAEYVQPALVVETARFDHKRFALPLADGVSHPGRLRILGKA